MAYTVTKLITNAYYLSTIVSKDFQTVAGDQLYDGLDMLNALLSSFATNNVLIPYYSSYDITPTDGVASYFVTNLVSVDNLTFYLDNDLTVRYSSYELDRTNFFGSARAENVLSLPFQWHMERGKGGATIYLYFKPQDVFKVTIWGKFMAQNVTLNQDLSLTFDLFYIDFLKFSLAEYLCANNGIILPISTQKILNNYREKLVTISPLDMFGQKISTLTTNCSLNYGDVNIGRGFRPLNPI